MEKTTTYTSPLTGVTYGVAHTTSCGWTRWEVLLEGRMVQFALSPEGVADSVRFLEVGDGVTGSRFD